MKADQLCIPCDANERTFDTGSHKHRCPQCQTTWKHADDVPDQCVSEREFVQAHTCPNCGTQQYWKHWTKEEEREVDRAVAKLRRDPFLELLLQLRT